jgi:hypothetical protein
MRKPYLHPQVPVTIQTREKLVPSQGFTPKDRLTTVMLGYP